MLNILMPMAGNNRYDSDEYRYPKPLIEIHGMPMIEHVINKFKKIDQEKRFIFTVNTQDCQEYHLDNVLQLITDGQCEIVKLSKQTMGAACSAMMAVDYIDNDDALIISNSDHIISYDLNKVLNQFEKNNLDAGTICFESIHPKWSFVRLDEDNKIIETAEKNPLSKNAIAGFYYFKKGSEFISSSMKMIEKDASVSGHYYVAPALNEMVLSGRNLEIFKMPSEGYFNFYDSHKLKEYEKQLVLK